jgi:membrane-associated phospholipid phosphatase
VAGGFLALTAALYLPAVRGLDLTIRDLADAHRPPVADLLAQNLNRLGSGGPLAAVALLIAGWLAVRRRSWRPIAPVVAVFLLTTVVIGPLKLLLDRAAPHSALPDDVKVRLFSDPDGMSYPSGHAVNAIVWYGVILALLFGSVSPWIRWVPPVIVCAAGTYLGYHWLTDMLAGVCLGVLLDRLLRHPPAMVAWRHAGTAIVQRARPQREGLARDDEAKRLRNGTEPPNKASTMDPEVTRSRSESPSRPTST